MRRWIALVCLLAAASVEGVFAEEERTPSVPEDLFAVITLQGKPCGAVVEHRRLGDNDYEVSCRSGDRYHVYVRDGRVVVEAR